MKRQSRSPIGCMTAGIVASILFSSCGDNKRDCPSVSADQKASFMPGVSGFPIQVSADDQFVEAERNSIMAAVREWNQKGQKFIGSDYFSVQFKSLPDSLRQLNPHDCGSELGGEQDFAMVRELNQSHWSAIGFEQNTPGATIRCYDGDNVSRQIIYMNPTLMRSNQLDQAFSHELGHSLGLDHSCKSGSGSSDFIGCSSVSNTPSHPYFLAVMYPVLKNTMVNMMTNVQSAANRVAAVINSNDETRAQCVTSSN